MRLKEFCVFEVFPLSRQPKQISQSKCRRQRIVCNSCYRAEARMIKHNLVCLHGVNTILLGVRRSLVSPLESVKTRCHYVTRSVFVSLKSFAFPSWIFLSFKRRCQRSQTRIVKISRAYIVSAYAFSGNIFTEIVHIPDVRRNILEARTNFANTKYSYRKPNKSNNADIRGRRVKALLRYCFVVSII